MKENQKFNIILVLLILLVILNVFIGFNRMSNEISSLNYQLGNLQHHLQNVTNNFDNLEVNIRNELKKQGSILTDYNISYDNADPSALRGDIIIEVVPKEYSDSTSATINIGDKSLPMNRQGSSFTAVIPVPINIIYSQFTLNLKEGDTIRSEVVTPGEIGFVNELAKNIEASYSGVIPTYDIKDKYAYNGQIHVYNPKGKGNFTDIKLIVLKNGNEIIWETDDFINNKEQGVYTVDINKTFPLEKKDSLYIFIEAKDRYGFKYKAPVYGSEINVYEGVTGASTYMERSVYDAQGNVIEFKNY